MGSAELQRLRTQLDAALGAAERREPLQQLAILAASGDQQAVELLLVTIDHHGLAQPAISRQLFNPEDQRDVEQDAMVAVARSIGSFRGDAHVLTWLHTVATNCALAFVRKRRATQPLDDADELSAPASWNARFTSIATTNMAVHEAIATLPEHYRDAVVLRDLEHQSYAQVAEQLGLNLNTTRARIARGRAMVANQLGESVVGMEAPL